jgi:hypothetical protein
MHLYICMHEKKGAAMFGKKNRFKITPNLLNFLFFIQFRLEIALHSQVNVSRDSVQEILNIIYTSVRQWL